MGNETENRNGMGALESNRAAGERKRESGRKPSSESGRQGDGDLEG